MRQGSTSSALAIDDRGEVQLWTMQLAPVNAINAEMLDAFEAGLDAAERDEQVSAVVVNSSLKVFSAGADATWMAQAVEERGPQGLLADFNATMDRFRSVCIRIREAPFLVVAAIDGHALAGGLELAAACDLRFSAADDRLRLGVPEMDLFGCLPSGGGGTQFLARIMGPSRALEFILNAKPISPSRAFDLGLIDRLCTDTDALTAALTFAREVAGKAGRIGVTCAKRAVFVAGELPLDSAMVLDSTMHWDTMRRGNFLAGVKAFAARYASGRAR
jgi:enoyl-CoA hydratase